MKLAAFVLHSLRNKRETHMMGPRGHHHDDDEEEEEPDSPPQKKDETEWSEEEESDWSDEEDLKMSAENRELWESFVNKSDPFDPLCFSCSTGVKVKASENHTVSSSTASDVEDNPEQSTKERATKVAITSLLQHVFLVCNHVANMWTFKYKN